MKNGSTDLLEALEAAVLEALHDTSGKDRTDAVNAGIKLLAIKHRITGKGEDADYFSQP